MDISRYNLRQMLDFYQEMLTTARASVDIEKQVFCQNYISSVLRLMGRWEESLKCQANALAMAKAEDYKLAQSVSLSNLGSLYAEMGRYNEALDHLEQSYSIALNCNNLLRQASALGTKGKVYLNIGRWNDAERCFKKALRKGEEGGSVRHQMCSLTSLGILENAKGIHTNAEKYIKQASDFAQLLESNNDRASNGTTLPDGSFCIEEAMKSKRDVFVLLLTKIKIDRLLGRTEIATFDIDGVIQFALEIGYKYGHIDSLIEKSRCLLALQKLEESISLIERAVTESKALGSKHQLANALLVRAVLESRNGDNQLAVQNFQQSHEIFDEIGDDYNTGLALLNWGIYTNDDDLNGQSAIRILSGVQKISSTSKVSESADVIADFLNSTSYAARQLEKKVFDILNNSSRIVENSDCSLHDAYKRLLEINTTLTKYLLLARVYHNSSKLFLSLCQGNTSLKKKAEMITNSIGYQVVLMQNVEESINAQISQLGNQIRQEHAEDESDRTLMLQLLQIFISGIGASAVYVSVLQLSSKPFTPWILGELLICLVAWGSAPITIYAVKAFSVHNATKILISCLNAVMLIWSAVLLYWRVT